MLKPFAVFVALVLISAALVPAASAQTYPNVKNVKAFSAAANFMSLTGYLRYLVHQRTGQWLTMLEAGRVVEQQ
jgi:hypothetical protein